MTYCVRHEQDVINVPLAQNPSLFFHAASARYSHSESTICRMIGLSGPPIGVPWSCVRHTPAHRKKRKPIMPARARRSVDMVNTVRSQSLIAIVPPGKTCARRDLSTESHRYGKRCFTRLKRPPIVRQIRLMRWTSSCYTSSRKKHDFITTSTSVRKWCLQELHFRLESRQS